MRESYIILYINMPIYTTKDINNAIDLAVLENLSQNEISRRTGVNKGTLREWFDKAGIEPNKKLEREIPEDIKKRICYLYENFYSTTEISIIMSMSKKLVRSTLLRCEVELRSRGESISLFRCRVEILRQRELRRLRILAMAGDDKAIGLHVEKLYSNPKADILTKEEFEIQQLSIEMTG